MNYLIKRIVVGVCVAIVMMMVHHIARASDFVWSYAGATKGYPTAMAACLAANATTTQIAQTVQGYACKNGTNTLSNVYIVSGTCTAPNTVNPATGVCAAPAAPICTAGASTTFNASAPSGSLLTAATARAAIPTNDGSCNIQSHPTVVDCWHYTSSPTSGYCTYTGIQTGVAAPQNDAFTPPTGVTPLPASVTASGDPATGCPAGLSNIGTDSTGTPICSGSGTSPATSPNTTTTNPTTTSTSGTGSSAVTTTTSSSSNQNSDGSSTTNTNTCVTPASTGSTTCTTTQSTSASSSGAPGVADGKSAAASGSSGAASTPPDDMCSLHPELNACTNSQVTSSGCSGAVSTVAVTGDAIQGAILQSLANEQCANSVPTAASTLGTQMMNGQDPLQSSLPTKANGSTVNGTNLIDQTGFLGGGSCMADQSFAYANTTLVIPFSTVCPYLLPLRAAIMLAALIAAYYMLSGAILRE
ncbi:hypothetical protein [Glaciimonas soli]|uniref:Uncharacterized protein n=1 Tax=Glaciimonas soli TaxID=2590999 RepID=A0A843YP94_9BURK|nr:hypothetical protein [Glaciimonas soli]MQQ99257.1 hypothetical protein [Glaciimonas soli]